ncbi:hypothetical protein FKW77_009671 [Venturia effusa]|uniref:Uncharacterized protein n=1 Tax=Venturia effusa TaxID=50376 RepID=A0A517L851_9PEZI|nr:hypothetical protein FKW77_009671 [Venturia effusa]
MQKVPRDTYIEPKRAANAIKPPMSPPAPILTPLLAAVVLTLATALVADVAVTDVDAVVEDGALALATIPPSTVAGAELLPEVAAADL